MDAGTYPDPRTVAFVDRFMIAHRVNTSMSSALAVEWGIRYTPTVITLDGDGKEHHRSVGFLPPEEFVPHLMLGIARGEFKHGRFDKALLMVENLLSLYSRSRSAPEATELQQACLRKRG